MSKKICEERSQILNLILQEHTGIDFSCGNFDDIDLFSRSINIPVRNLVLIYIDIEKRMGIKLPDENIIAGAFRSVSSIRVLLGNI